MNSSAPASTRPDALGPGDVIAFFEAWLRLLLVWHGLKRHSLPSLMARYGARGNLRHGARRAPALKTIERYRLATRRAAARHWVPNRCLVRALSLYWALARRGIQTTLEIGVALPEQQTLEAHAWLEFEGRPIDEEANVTERFAPLRPVR